MFGRPIVTNCDWLSGSFKFDPLAAIEPPKGYKYVALDGTSVFRERYYLLDSEGNKVLTLCCKPYSKVIPEDVGTYQIANPYLYNPPIDKFAAWLNSFRRGYHNGVTRWDVCTDFCPTDRELKTIRALASGAQYVSGKKQGSLYWHSDTYNGKEVRAAHCMSWGSPTSAIKSKLYHKSREIGVDTPALCTKPYIVDEWSGHLPDINNVWRLEFSFNSVNQFSINNRRLSLEDALTPLYYVSAFAEIKRKSFVVRMNQGKREGHKNLDAIVPFLPYDLEGCVIKKIQYGSDRSTLDDERAVVRRLWFALQSPSVLYDDDRYVSVRNTIYSYAADPRILGYLDHICDGAFLAELQRLDDMRVSDVTKLDINPPSDL